MEANSILEAELLDILFDGRNKEYGAYELRKTYNRRITSALIASTVFGIALFVANFFTTSERSGAKPVFVTPEINLSKLDQKTREIVRSPTVKPQTASTKKKDVVPVIVPDIRVKPSNMVKPNDAFENVQIGSTDEVAKDTAGAPAPPLNESTEQQNALSNRKEKSDRIDIVEIEAKFPGGIEAWTKYLKRNLRTDIPVDNGAPEGSYIVVVSFLVDNNGNVADVQAVNDPGYGTAEEAVRVIKQSKRWIPAIQNGRNVTYRQQQSITFVVQAQ